MAWETKTHDLEYPVEKGDGYEGREFSKVTFKMPNGRALRAVEALLKTGAITDEIEIGIDVTMKLMAILSDLTDDEVDELHVVDVVKAGEVMGPFLESTFQKLGMKAETEAQPVSPSPSPDGGAKTAKP